MQRVSVTASLNGVAIPFDHAAFVRLEAYLADAEQTLAGNPDKAEILADLEQAVADQCKRRMRLDQVRVTLAELEPALAEIGSVQDPEVAEPPPVTVARRLEQVSEGAVISGVCLGLAHYFRLDVTLLRIIAVLLLLGTGGGMILVYLALMLLMPYAPLETGGAPVRWLPAKCRRFVEALRSKLGVEQRGNKPA